MNLTNTNSLLSLMSVIYTQAQRKRVRVTLTLDVLNDFEARNIDWRKVLQLEDNESVESYTEELDIPAVW